MTALYIHIPFCTKICPYCDFHKGIWNAESETAFVDALIREWRCYESVEVSSLFLGGGTPSALSAAALTRIFSALRLPDGIEKTVEVNPESASAEKLEIMKRFGINRISLGVQSFVPEELAFLGRQHTPEVIGEAIERVKKAGFANFNLDLIYGLPISSKKNLRHSLEKALEFEPTHISTYSLSIEEGTPFHKRGVKKCAEGKDLALSKFIRHYLIARGFEHYEVSAYAKKGFESRHNLAYWRLDDYIGLGPGAASYFGGKFYQNPRDTRSYIENPKPAVSEDSRGADVGDFLMTNLRLLKGFSMKTLTTRFGIDFEKTFGVALRRLQEQKLLRVRGQHVRVTTKGMYVLNKVLLEF